MNAADSLQLDPQLLLTFLPNFEAYKLALNAKPHPSVEEQNIASTVSALVTYLHTDYRATLTKFAHLAGHGETTSDLIALLLVPRSTLLTRCEVTGELQALTLVEVTKHTSKSGSTYELLCEALDWNPEAEAEGRFIRTQTRIVIKSFPGTVKITELDAYPIQYHPAEQEVRSTLLERGRKWAQFTGVHHMCYKATAVIRCEEKVIKYNVGFAFSPKFECQTVLTTLVLVELACDD